MRITPFPPLDLPRILRVHTDRRVRRARATVVLLHGIGNTAAYWDTVEQQLPADVRIISIDLLGFGDSPKPSSASYNLRIQARSVAMTLLTLGLTNRIIVVGHSMGSLIAVELAKRYPLLVRGLVLCSPPIYRTAKERRGTFVNAEAILTDMYTKFGQDASANPARYVALAKAAASAKLAPPTFHLTDDTVMPYITALRASIVDQSSFTDIQHLTTPTEIIYGTFDPFVVVKNLKTIAKSRSDISLHSVLASHEITKAYLRPIANCVRMIMGETATK
jgi:pimeloyl-ACP methyl ester carboxylesterase